MPDIKEKTEFVLVELSEKERLTELRKILLFLEKRRYRYEITRSTIIIFKPKYKSVEKKKAFKLYGDEK